MGIRTNGVLGQKSLHKKQKWVPICSRAYCLSLSSSPRVEFEPLGSVANGSQLSQATLSQATDQSPNLCQATWPRTRHKLGHPPIPPTTSQATPSQATVPNSNLSQATWPRWPSLSQATCNTGRELYRGYTNKPPLKDFGLRNSAEFLTGVLFFSVFRANCLPEVLIFFKKNSPAAGFYFYQKIGWNFGPLGTSFFNKIIIFALKNPLKFFSPAAGFYFFQNLQI